MARPNILFLSLLLIATIFVAASAEDCLYTIKVQTGTRSNSGTDAKIGVVIADASGEYIVIDDLVKWGGVPGWDYYENGNLDIFSARERCLPSPVCFLTLKSDGCCKKPGWFVVYVDVTTTKTGTPTKHQTFGIDQWLALDEAPYELSTERDNCPKTVESKTKKSLYSIV